MTQASRNRITVKGLNLAVALSPGQLEVAQLVVYGMTNPEIATTLDRPEHTIKSILRRILNKIEATSRNQVVTWMYESGHALPGTDDFPNTPPRPYLQGPLGAPTHIAPLGRVSPEDPVTVDRLRRQLIQARIDLDSLITAFGNL